MISSSKPEIQELRYSRRGPPQHHNTLMIGFVLVEFVEVCTPELRGAEDGIKGSCTEIVVQGANVQGTDVLRVWNLLGCIGELSKRVGMHRGREDTQDSEGIRKL